MLKGFPNELTCTVVVVVVVVVVVPGIRNSLHKGEGSQNYTLFHEKNSTFFSNNISFPERRNKRKSVLEITKMYYF